MDKMEDTYALKNGKKLQISGSWTFIKDLKEMLDIMVKSPTASKLLDFNASMSQPLKIKEWDTNPLAWGRNTGHEIEIASKTLPNGEKPSKYNWLTLIPHEIRHSYNIPKTKSRILNSLAYAIANEADAHAIESLIALELKDIMDKKMSETKENDPDYEGLQRYSHNPDYSFFKKFYDNANGDDLTKKSIAMTDFVKAYNTHQGNDRFYPSRTFAELFYRWGVEREISPNGGWDRLNEETFPIKERELFEKEKEIIKKEWPTFCKRVMDGTFNTDVIQYSKTTNGDNKAITPENLVETVSPKLANHFREMGIISQTKKSAHILSTLSNGKEDGENDSRDEAKTPQTHPEKKTTFPTATVLVSKKQRK